MFNFTLKIQFSVFTFTEYNSFFIAFLSPINMHLPNPSTTKVLLNMYIKICKIALCVCTCISCMCACVCEREWTVCEREW